MRFISNSKRPTYEQERKLRRMKLPLLLILFVFGASASNRNPDENAGVLKPDLFQGDMILNTHQRLALKLGLDVGGGMVSRGATAFSSLVWRNQKLPYTIDPTLAVHKSATMAIKAAMKDIEQRTCITFKKKTTEPNYVNFMMGTGCWSYVGCQGGKQDLSLDYGCWDAGTVAHEIAHTLGFHHEQSRPDRDQYVTINRNNVLPGFLNKFGKYTASHINSLGVPYDYGSLMHYGSHYFSMNGQPTIVPKQAGVTIGQRVRLSYFDTFQMNLLYKCSCRDSLFHCPNYAHKCYDYNFRWVRPYCKRTCSLC